MPPTKAGTETYELTRGEKLLMWVITTFFIGIGLPVVGFLWRQSVQSATMQTTMSSMSGDVGKLTDTIESLVARDLADIKTRLSLNEKQLLKLSDVEQRLRVLEHDNATHNGRSAKASP